MRLMTLYFWPMIVSGAMGDMVGAVGGLRSSAASAPGRQLGALGRSRGRALAPNALGSALTSSCRGLHHTPDSVGVATNAGPAKYQRQFRIR